MTSSPDAGVILIVEDPSICRLVKSVLQRQGREVVEIDEPQALHMLECGETPVRLLITNRPQAFERLAGAVPTLYLASAPDWELAARTRGVRVLQKPFHAKDLIEAVGDITSWS